MPFTPFHFGPGAAAHALAPKYVSFLAFCAANVLIDTEPLYFMVTGQFPVHRFFHTCIGASLVAVVTVVLFVAARRTAPYLRLPNVFDWQGLKLLPVSLGAAIGTLSHVALDSIMHADIRPFAPFTDANPLLHVVSLPQLHRMCLAAGGIGLLIIGVHHLRRRAPRGSNIS
jgi:membrane-bound metal-dependent hydrolase YbcI (DUF457 family)